MQHARVEHLSLVLVDTETDIEEAEPQPLTDNFPERCLLRAVLEEAITTLLRHAHKSRLSSQHAAAEAQAWFDEQGDDQSPYWFSFLQVCDVLCLDPGFIRRGLATRLAYIADHPRAKISVKTFEFMPPTVPISLPQYPVAIDVLLPAFHPVFL